MDYQRIQDPDYKIPFGEPVFLIRGQDSVGAETLRAYADLFEKAGGDSVVAQSVRAHALLMDAWSKKKVADIPNGTAITTATSLPVEGSPGERG